MRTDRRPSFGRFLWLALVLPLATHASWMTEYDRGEKAVKEQQWAEAEARFQQAIREAAEPMERKRFQGVIHKPYVPHFYAGLAAYQQGACERALEYWKHPATDSVLGKLPELRAKQQAGLSDCTARLAKAAAAAAPPVAQQPAVSAPAPAAPSSPTSAASTTRPAASVPPATKPLATPAVTKPSVARVEPPAPKPAATAPAAAVAPAALRALVDSYLKGSYQEVAANDPASLPDARARAQGFMLRAASRHALALLSADGSAAAQQALQLASADVRAAKAAQASLNPDAVLFSPRFRSFWQQTR